MKIFVSSLALAPTTIQRERCSHVVSLLSPEEIHLAPEDLPTDRRLRLAMHDLRGAEVAPGETPPAAAHVEQLLAFAQGWRAEAPILVHCWAGISRSTAAAFTIACARNPHADEREIAWEIRRVSHTAWPNPIIVDYADKALGRNGRMLAAIEAIGPGRQDASRPFHLPADFPASKPS